MFLQLSLTASVALPLSKKKNIARVKTQSPKFVKLIYKNKFVMCC